MNSLKKSLFVFFACTIGLCCSLFFWPTEAVAMNWDEWTLNLGPFQLDLSSEQP